MKEQICFNCKFCEGKNCAIHLVRIDWEDFCGKYEEGEIICRNCTNYNAGFCAVQNDRVSTHEMCGYFHQILSPELLSQKRR